MTDEIYDLEEAAKRLLLVRMMGLPVNLDNMVASALQAIREELWYQSASEYSLGHISETIEKGG